MVKSIPEGEIEKIVAYGYQFPLIVIKILIVIA